MIKDIYYNYSPNQLKTDQLYSLKLFKEEIIMVLVQETSKVYSKLLKMNKQEEET